MVPINRMSAAQAAPAFLISPLLKLDGIFQVSTPSQKEDMSVPLDVFDLNVTHQRRQAHVFSFFLQICGWSFLLTRSAGGRVLCHQVGIHGDPYLAPTRRSQCLKISRLTFPSFSGRGVIIQPVPEKEKTKVSLTPPLSLRGERSQGLSGASRACVRNGICAGDGAPNAFLAGVGTLLGPLQCFQGKVRTFVTVPGSRPARDLGFHSPLASRQRDAQEAGLHQLFAGCPERAYFGNNTARC